MSVDRRSSFPGFAQLLRQHRLAASLTQEELAERAGISARGISDLERGARSHPHRETLRLLADALGLSGAERSAFMRAAPRMGGRAGGRLKPAAAQHPVPLTPLVGRREERAGVTSLLKDTAVRLVTLTGPGGVGKTRLALAVTEQVSHEFPDGLVFVALAPLRDPGLVVSQVATTLGVRESAGRTLTDILHDFLRGREMLIVLDNLEHLRPAAPNIADLLAAAPKVKVLATSRAPLRLRGEREYPVPVLRLPSAEEARNLAVLAENEAVAFFVDRARAVQPKFELTADNAAPVIEICQRLDGLPLALELAAAWVKVLPTQLLLTRLDARLPLLTGGARDAPERQRTLRDTIVWSHHLLSPQPRILFHRLGVFVGGWTLEAAEAVAAIAGDLDVLEGLASLVDLSLIRLDESGAEPRYSMLETIREFARDQLAKSGEEATLSEAHAAYFLIRAEHAKPQLSAAGQGVWLRRLEADHPNFRLALGTLAARDDHDAYLRLAANLGFFWWMRAHLAEGRLHLERALSLAPAPTPHRAEALTGIGRIVTSQGELAAGEMWLRQSEALSRSLNLPALLWQALFELGQVVEYAGDAGRAVPIYQSALAVSRELDDTQAASVALWALSEAAYGRGDLETAGRLSEDTIVLLRSGGEEFMLSLCLVTIGEVALERGDLSRAVAAYQEALELALGIDMYWAIASALAGFAAVAAARGHHVAAAKMLGAAATLRET
ncbi:MAG: helix-turn-helix domain-containing protein, partial [Chloroflexi bacterium]|nr:helix-turn-helix domain-containing protein [Chloroflexota bacterium]